MSEVEPTDDELVRRSIAGEPHAFAQLVAKHQRLVFGVALSSARDVVQAEDVAQEAFVEAWRDLPRLRDPARVGSWIAGIARNLAHGWKRRTARRQAREAAVVETAPELAPTPLDSALERETHSLVRAALAKIPAAYREALVLYYVHGRSVAEVASGLRITEDLAKQRLSRGRRALRASLEARVEGALEQLGPSKGFTAAVMVAVSAATARRAAAAGSAGKVLVGMKATKVAVIGIVLVVAGGAAWYWRSSSAASPAGTRRATEHRPRASGLTVRKLSGRETREQLVQAIRRAQEHRLAAVAAPAAPAPPPSTTTSRAAPKLPDVADGDDPDKDYVQHAMVALAPMIGDCYRNALDTHPALAGTLVVKFTIEGEPGIGGVVTETAVDTEHSEINDPGLSQCVQETMYALEIDPPMDGVTVHVTYPFTFGAKE